RVVILDFGLVSDPGKREDHAVGTVAYMAPEQTSGAEVGPAADWYAVGVTLFRALTGVFPFSGTAEDVIAHKQRRDPPPPSSFLPSIPPDLDALCADLLRRLPEQRPRDREILARLGVTVGAEPPTGITSFVGRARELATLEAAFAHAAAAGGAVLIHGESG